MPESSARWMRPAVHGSQPRLSVTARPMKVFSRSVSSARWSAAEKYSLKSDPAMVHLTFAFVRPSFDAKRIVRAACR
jgi:hypothetical protein